MPVADPHPDHKDAVMNGEQLIRIIGVAIIMLAVVGFVITVQAVVLGYSPLPFWDQWERVTPGQHLAGLLTPHNEHRIFVPTLFFIVDTAVFGGRNVFNLFAIQIIQVLHAALLIIVARAAGVRGVALAPVAGLIAALLFSGAQIENFYWGFQVQFVIVYLLATATVAGAVMTRDNWRNDAAILAVGFAAAFSFSAGLLALPAAAVGSFLAGRGRRRTGALALGAVIAAVLYMSGLETSGHSDPVASLNHPVEVLYYMLVYLGAPFGDAFANSVFANYLPPLRDPIEAAQLIGSGGLAVAIALAAITLFRRGPKARIVLVIVLGIVIAAGFLTALGRWELGAQQAFASRYATPVLIFWAVIGALTVSLARGLPRRAWRTAAGLVLPFSFLVAVLLLLGNRDAWMEIAQTQHDRTNGAVTAVLVGAPDSAALTGVYPWPDRVLEQRQALQSAALSVFAGEQAGWLGAQWTDIAPLAPEGSCIGYVDARAPVSLEADASPGFVRLAGWAWVVGDGRSPMHLVTADAGGRVVGLGRRAIDRPDVANAVPDIDEVRTGWMAHAAATSDEPLTVYAIIATPDGRRACRLGAL